MHACGSEGDLIASPRIGLVKARVQRDANRRYSHGMQLMTARALQ